MAMGFGFMDKRWFTRWCECHGNFNNQAWVWWYPKNAITKEHQNKFTHVKASFVNVMYVSLFKKCGINLPPPTS